MTKGIMKELLGSEQANSRLLKAGLATQWKPHQSGNPAGRTPNSITTLLKNRDEKDNKELADVLWALALKGDMDAIRVVLDRKDGKVADKHLNLNVSVTPELLLQAQDRLQEAQDNTLKLLESHQMDVEGNETTKT